VLAPVFATQIKREFIAVFCGLELDEPTEIGG
jgi:hypothetical protein